MGFLKAIWRFTMGVKDVLVLCFLLLFFTGLFALLSLSGGQRPVQVKEGALLLDLDGTIVEQPRQIDPTSVLMSGEAPLKEYRLRDVIMALEAARTDPKVKTVVLDLDGFMGGGQVALSHVGKALDAVRRAKKPVLTYATVYTDSGYQLAAHASEIWLNPFGAVGITGPGGSQLYYKGLIDRLGITTHIFRVGTHKSAVEPFMRADQSPEAKADRQALADNLWQNWLANVGKARPQAQILPYSSNPVAMAEASQGDLSKAAMTAKLVDRLGDQQDFSARVAQLAGKAPQTSATSYAAIDLATYIRAKQPANDGQIGVITIAGEIIDGEAGPGIAAGDSIATLIQEALATGKLKALVVRVDSPGGSALASERIRKAIAAARQQKLPVVVSMGNIAASGGYWVSTAADRIFAEPSTITGSIGVFGILPSFEGALAKIGVTSDGVRTTPLSGEPDMMGGLSPDFTRISQLGTEHIYRRFLGLVSDSRKIAPEKLDDIAQGRIWDGGTARQLGLIDAYGGINEAMAEAAKLAKIDPADARPFYIEPKIDNFTQLLEQMIGNGAAPAAGKDLLARQALYQQALLVRALQDARHLAGGGSVQARCLECAALSPASQVNITEAGSPPSLWLNAIKWWLR